MVRVKGRNTEGITDRSSGKTEANLCVCEFSPIHTLPHSRKVGDKVLSMIQLPKEEEKRSSC